MLRKLIILACLLFGAMAFANSAERWALYPFDPTHVAPDLPGVNEDRLMSDGNELVVWHSLPTPGKPMIFYLHGNAGNLASRRGRFSRFIDRGYGLFALAYPGSSGSQGTPSEASITKAALDAYVALRGGDFDTKYTEQDVVIYGESLGTAATIALLDQLQTASVPGPGAVILEAPFTSLKALAQHHYGELSWLVAYLDSSWPSLARAQTVLTAPLLVLHGTDDALIPQAQGRSVFNAAPTRQKQFLSVKGGTHTTLWRSDVLPQMWRFIDGLGR